MWIVWYNIYFSRWTGSWSLGWSRTRPEAADLRHSCCCRSRSCMRLMEPWPCPSHHDFALAAVASRPRLIGANLEPVISTGSALSRTKTLGRVAASLRAYTLSPADTRLSPQHWLGAAGCNSRAGLVRFTLAQADYELGHEGHDRVRCAARLHARMHTPDHLCPRAVAHTRSIIITEYEFACVHSAPRRRGSSRRALTHRPSSRRALTHRPQAAS